MSTLFNSYYDSLGNELTYGSPVCFRSSGYFIYGIISEIIPDAKSEYKYVVVPTIGYKGPGKIELKKKYKVNHNRVFLLNINKH